MKLITFVTAAFFFFLSPAVEAQSILDALLTESRSKYNSAWAADSIIFLGKEDSVSYKYSLALNQMGDYVLFKSRANQAEILQIGRIDTTAQLPYESDELSILHWGRDILLRSAKIEAVFSVDPLAYFDKRNNYYFDEFVLNKLNALRIQGEWLISSISIDSTVVYDEALPGGWKVDTAKPLPEWLCSGPEVQIVFDGGTVYCAGDDQWRSLRYDVLGPTLAVGSIRASLVFINDDELTIISDRYILDNQLIQQAMSIQLRKLK